MPSLAMVELMPVIYYLIVRLKSKAILHQKCVLGIAQALHGIAQTLRYYEANIKHVEHWHTQWQTNKNSITSAVGQHRRLGSAPAPIRMIDTQ